MSLNGIQPITNRGGVLKLCISTAGLNTYFPFIVGAATLLELGFKPHEKIRAGYWWAIEDVPAICDALSEAIDVVKQAASTHAP